MRLTALVATLVISGSLVAAAQERPEVWVHDKADQLFVEAVAAVALGDASLSALAERQAAGAGIRTFARRSGAADGRSRRDLESLAAAKGMSLPTTPAPEDQERRDRLAAASGRAFDREYLDAIVRSLSLQVDLFEHEAEWGLDAELRSWAAATLTSIRARLAEARALT